MKQPVSSQNEFELFNTLVDRIIAVPKTEILRREAEYRNRAELNPRRRGPKKKIKSSVVPVPDASPLA